MFLHIEYLNKDTGELTTRKIRIQKVEKAKNGYLITAYCYYRNDQRTFNMDQILKATHDEFGEITDKKKFLRENFPIEDVSLKVKEKEKEKANTLPLSEIQFDILNDHNFSRYCICLTGKSWNKIDKAEIYTKLKGFGASTTDSYNNNVNLLVVLGDPKAPSSKLSKSIHRRSNGEAILIINEDYFWTLFDLKIAS